MNLWDTPARDLDSYIETHLLPDTTFQTEVHRAIHTISNFLKDRCFRGTWKSVRVTKIVRGGSSGKGTALRDCSKVDLVVFLSDLRSYQDQIDRRREFIEEIKKQLEEYELEQEWMFAVKFKVNKPTKFPQVLSFSMKSNNISQWMDFHIFPAFDVLGQMNRDLKKPDPHIYIDLIKESQAGEEFFICFTELQNSFFNHRCNKLKNLVRLVKHWYKMCKEKMDSLPPQYALELLTIYAWEHGSQEINFSIARGFQTVLYLIQKYQELMIYWTINYDTQNETIARYLCCQLQKHRPVILDPADPTSDVGGGKKWSWDKLAQEAERWSTASCLQNWDGSWVQPWNVPVEQTLEASQVLNLMSNP
ncbi:2'-5'-oligoadenylate synthase 1 isoform X2 [Sarcophilus harrisii]|nr:2'-5'-oligoadenylate synthase 1 isoform X2 [Sarcophilus harrisii]